MKLNEAEMRMAYQIEATSQSAALNEIYMTWRYAPNRETKDTAESLLKKLRPLSDKECMDVIWEVQANYRLPGKARTVGEMLADELLRLFGQFADADRTIVVGTDGRGAEGEHCGSENQKLFHGVSFFK